jgi:hypothetical protein
MPNPVAPATPVGVLPRILANAFTVEMRYEALVNQYPDGASERVALSLNPRRYFQITRALSTAQRDELWNFYLAHKGIPFYVYVPRETIPPFSYDPTGEDPIGRDTVVFDGSYSETTAIPRVQAGLSLREVA